MRRGEFETEKREKELVARSGAVQRPKHDEDRYVADDTEGIYGVFDGLGGGGGYPARAAEAARDAVYTALVDVRPDSVEHMELLVAQALELAKTAVIERGWRGSTTATFMLVKKIKNKVYGSVAHAGDCRLYVLRDGVITQVTEDQGSGQWIFNCLYGNSYDAKHQSREDSFITLELHKGDRLVLCTDGITGDYDDEILTDNELTIAAASPTPREAADDILAISRKDDDKTVVVVDV